MVDRLRGALLALGLLLLIGSAAVFLVRYRIYAVPTRSMTPAIEPGDRIVVDTWARVPVVGDVVLADGPTGYIVKRVADGTTADRVYLLGDNPDVSLDSRMTGTISAGLIRGRVVALAYPDPAFLPGRGGPVLPTLTWGGTSGLALVLLAAAGSALPRTR